MSHLWPPSTFCSTLSSRPWASSCCSCCACWQAIIHPAFSAVSAQEGKDVVSSAASVYIMLYPKLKALGQPLLQLACEAALLRLLKQSPRCIEYMRTCDTKVRGSNFERVGCLQVATRAHATSEGRAGRKKAVVTNGCQWRFDTTRLALCLVCVTSSCRSNTAIAVRPDASPSAPFLCPSCPLS